MSFAPPGLVPDFHLTHGSRRGLHFSAASRLCVLASFFRGFHGTRFYSMISSV
jgi:hypothetical protein